MEKLSRTGNYGVISLKQFHWSKVRTVHDSWQNKLKQTNKITINKKKTQHKTKQNYIFLKKVEVEPLI